jgi:methylenetetrahydrofolate reductase (NADPH)
MGVENILSLTGDGHREAFTGKPKPVFDLDSVLILTLIEEMRKGVEYKQGSRDLQTTPFDFLPGAVVTPYKVREPDQMMQLYKLHLKIATGAKFVITQLGYDIRRLYELKQYMDREDIGHVPVIANVYVPTATIAKIMQAGEVPGCVITDELIRRLEGEKKPQRLERAALMVAATRGLGFAGVHIGGFGLTHKNVATIIDRSKEIGLEWRSRMDELLFPYPDQFHLLPEGSDGLSDGDGEYQLGTVEARKSWNQRISTIAHRLIVNDSSIGARLLSPQPPSTNGQLANDDSWRHGLRYTMLGLSEAYRRKAWDCLSCGDCIQDHLNFPGCTMSQCYKELRNGPCGGSRVDGQCEVDPNKPCIWNVTYENTLAAGDDPTKFGRTLIPPRNWSLNLTNAMANHLVGLDNTTRRQEVRVMAHGTDDSASAREPPLTDVGQRLNGDQEARVDNETKETQEVGDGSKRG